MNTRASLVGGNPTPFTLFRRFTSQNIGVIALAASVLLGLVFEWKVVQYILQDGVLVVRVFFYGTLALFTILALLAHVTVSKRGGVIDSLADIINERGRQPFVTKVSRVLVRRSLAKPELIPALDVIYPIAQFLVTRAGFYLPKDYAELLRVTNTTAVT